MKEKFKTQRSKIQGKGCFATVDIKKGEIICEMQGEKISIPEVEARYKNGKERFDDPLQISERCYVDLDKPYLYFNHSCNPNAYIRGVRALTAIRAIKTGEEITYDYSAVEWTDKEFARRHRSWSMRCICNSMQCRKIIGDFLTLPKRIQEKHIRTGHVQNFIIRKYKKAQKLEKDGK